MMPSVANQQPHPMEQYVLRELTEKGYALLKDFPENEIYPLLQSIGKIFIQESGMQHAVKYEDGFDDYRYSKSLNEIGPHTEFPFYDTPPRIQILHCLQQANCGGGQTYLCSIKGFIDGLTDDQLEILSSAFIDFSANKDIAALKARSAKYPIFQRTTDSFIFRFSHNLLYYGDINAKISNEGQLSDTISRDIREIVKACLTYVENNRVECDLQKNNLLLWNNHSVLHWRNSYRDKGRHLVRYLLD
jgi:hypothetical protein